MKKTRKWIALVLTLCMLLLVAGCGTAAGQEGTHTEQENTMPKKYSILFIGNSYTYYNDMPTAIFGPFAQAAGYELEVTSITKGSYRLSQFADPQDEYGARVEQALTGEKKYDFVILQEQSSRPANDNVDLFYSAVRDLAARIRATGAEPILYSTWGRETGHSTLENNGWTNETMTWKLAAAYQAIGDELNIPVAHAGLAFYDIYTGDTDIDIYHTDKTHPSYEGSYLAAEQAAILREAARKAVFETPSIPDAYKTTSVGIGS